MKWVTKEVAVVNTLADGGSFTSFNNQFTAFRYCKEMNSIYKSDTVPAVIGDLATGSICYAVQGTQGNWNVKMNFRIRYEDA
jgi:hypothetical protein